jgi:hypothetical protein
MLLAKEKEEEQGADSRSSSRRSSFSASSYLGSSSSTSSTSTGTPSTSTPSSFLASLARATNDPNASPSSFLSLLIRPVQMVPRYRLLLDRLVEVAAKDEAKNKDKNMSTNKNSATAAAAAAASDESSDWCSRLEGGQRDWCSLEERLDLEHAGQAVQQVAAKLNDSLKVNCSWCLSSYFFYNADAQSAWNWIVVVC